MNSVSLLKPVKIAAMLTLMALFLLLSGCALTSNSSARIGGVDTSASMAVREGMFSGLPVNQNGSSATRNGITMSTQVGIDNIARLDSWAPVTITLENKGTARKGYIMVRQTMGNNAGTVYRHELDLATGAKKRVTLNIYLTPFGNGPIEAAFVSNGKALVRTVAPYSEVPPETEVIIAVTDDNANRQFFKDLAAESQQRGIAYMDAAELPSRATNLSVVKSIVISGASTGSLTRAQRDALSHWVASGGRLIVCGGPDWKKTISGLPEDIIPVTPSGVSQLRTFTPIAKFTGTGLLANPAAPIPITAASGVIGDIKAGDEATPLVVAKSLGKGQVTWVALDLTLEPFTSWRANAEFWNRLKGNPPGTQNLALFSGDFSGNMRNALSSIPALQVSGLSWLVPYIIIYILLIGPVNYIILKRRDRKELAWITIPAIILVFGLISFTYAYARKGGEILINQINIVEHYPGTSTTRIRSTIGVFSPSKRSYEMLFPENSSVAEVTEPGPPMPGNVNATPMVIEDGPRPKITGMNIGMWSMRTLQTERFTEAAMPLDGAISFDENRAIIKLQNKSGDALEDAVVIASGRIWHIGTIKPHELYTGDNTISELPAIGNFNGPPLGHRIYAPAEGPGFEPESMAMAETINSIFGYQGEKLPGTPVLIVWQNKPLQTAEIVGERPRLMGKTAHIVPLRVEPGKGLTLPLGSLSKGLVGPITQLTPDGFILDSEPVEFEFRLPPVDKPYTITKLILHFNGFPGGPEMKSVVGPGMPVEGGPDMQPVGYTISLYNWKTKTWHEVDPSPTPAKIPNAAHYVGPEGNILTRISTTTKGVNVTLFDFEVHGTWQN